MSAQRTQLGPFFDQGALCGGATMEHYSAGTNVLKNIWADEASSTTLAQPFVSDANGVFNFFADGYYKLVIKKADGTVLYTLDNWKIQDVAQPSISSGTPVATASTMDLGNATWAHWTGSTNVTTLTGTALFYWAIADGNFTLVHSSSLILPDSRNRKVLAGDTIFLINEGSNIYRLSGHTQKEGGWTGRGGTSFAATSTLAIPTDGDFTDISGGTNITALAVASAGYRFRARFTGTGLNIVHNGTSLISPWGRDYRTIQNEIVEFQSLGSGNWIFYSINGPRERVGTTIESNTSTVPAGYLEETGQAVSRATYAGLFGEIGTTFGTGDGSTTFNVPDTRGRMSIGVDGSASRVTSASLNGTNADTLGGAGGLETHNLTAAQNGPHTHTYNDVTVAGGTYANGANQGINAAATTGSSGTGDPHNNMPPWIAKRKYIRF